MLFARLKSASKQQGLDVCRKLRQIQEETHCTDQTCNQFIKAFGDRLSLNPPRKIGMHDKELHTTAGARVIHLHGCVGCNEFVWGPDDQGKLCPKCAAARYDVKKKPNEVVYYFPLKPQLEKLLSLPAYKKLLEHEHTRPRHSKHMTDVYDSPQWKKLVGKNKQLRVVLLFSGDGIPAFSKHKESISLHPHQYVNCSLPPALRYKAKFMLKFLLVPEDVKFKRKYFDFVARELQQLLLHGVNGIQVFFFGLSVDTKGREEMLGMQTCQVCTHTHIIYIQSLNNCYYCHLLFAGLSVVHLMPSCLVTIRAARRA